MSTIFYTESTPAASATGTVTPASLSVALTPTAGKTAYITGFNVTGTGATAASIVLITVSGLIGGSQNYFLGIPAGANTTITPLIVSFPIPIPASAPGTNITISVPSFGAGNVGASVSIYGYYK